MKKKLIKGLDLEVYSEKLSNGLEVYIIPFKNVKLTYATYTTRYGGNNNEFIPYGEKEMINVPKGIAHFLEHKMFEQEDGSDAFKYFNENGARANAYTSSKQTTYLFSGVNEFYNNLKHLLSYVESPYFTDKNVEKEKGIIKEEIHMGDDNPYSRVYKGLLFNSLINHPMKYPVIGTDESVSSITKEDLYKCYNTFYHPSNMFLVITGNVNPVITIKLIRDHENKRNLKSKRKITLGEYKEPNEVFRKEEKLKMDITVPKIGIAYKINIKDIKLNKYKVRSYILSGISTKLDETSLFYEKMSKKDILTIPVDLEGIVLDDHIIVMILAETNNPSLLLKEIKKELKDLSITEEEHNRAIKSSICSQITSSDNIFKMNSLLMSSIINNGEVVYNPIKRIRKYNLKEYKKIISSINLDNYTIFEIDPLKED